MRGGRCFLCYQKREQCCSIPGDFSSPCMAYTNAMIHITQSKLEQFIGQDTRSIRKPKQRMVREYRPQPHRSSMQNSLMTQTTQTRMPVYNFDLLSDDDISEDRKERKDCRHSRFSIYYKEGHMIYLKAIGQIPDTCPPFIRVSDDNNFVASIDEFG